MGALHPRRGALSRGGAVGARTPRAERRHALPVSGRALRALFPLSIGLTYEFIDNLLVRIHFIIEIGMVW